MLIQAPFNTQSYNRYSYVFNNPLSFTDPSGYEADGCTYNETSSSAGSCTTTGRPVGYQAAYAGSGAMVITGMDAQYYRMDQINSQQYNINYINQSFGNGFDNTNQMIRAGCNGDSSCLDTLNETEKVTTGVLVSIINPIDETLLIVAVGKKAVEGVVKVTVKALSTTASKGKRGWSKLGEKLKSFFGKGKNSVGKIDDLVNAANKPIAENGLSAASRKLSSHAQRKGGTFEKPTGNVQQQNAFAEKTLRDILENPSSKRTELSGGGFEIRQSSGQGVRYNADGSFSGFLDPRR